MNGERNRRINIFQLTEIKRVVAVVVQPHSHVQLCDTMDCSTPGLSVPCHLPKFAQVHVHCICDAVQPSHPLTPSSPSVCNLSQHQGLSKVSAAHTRGPKYWCFSISPSSEYSGLISLKIDWFDLHAVQGSLRSLPQNHSLKASILWHSAFFRVQLSQLYMNTGKTIALILWISVSRVMSLFFNTLSTFVTAFLLRSNCPLISWL